MLGTPPFNLQKVKKRQRKKKKDCRVYSFACKMNNLILEIPGANHVKEIKILSQSFCAYLERKKKVKSLSRV